MAALPTRSVLQDVRGFYGWRMVAMAAVCLAMSAPGQTVGVSVFVDPMIGELGLGRSQISGAYLVATLLGALALPRVGKALDHLGVRKVTLVVAVAFGGVLAAMSGVAGLASLTVAFVGIRLLGQGALTLSATTSVTYWFERRRGFAVGLMSAGGLALMSLAPLALASAISAFGWRQAWLVAALAVVGVVVPIALWGLKDHPSDVLQHLDGDPRPHARREAGLSGCTRAQAMRTGVFWVVAAAVSVSGMIGTGLAFHQISLLGERGLSVAQAAANFLPQTLAGIGGTLAMGVLVDRIAPRFLVSGAMASLVTAMVLAQTAAPGWRAVAFGIAAGAGGGAIRALEAAAFPRYFGLAHIGEIRGLVMGLTVASTALGPYALAVGFERFGSYGPALNLLLPLPLFVAVAAIFVRPPQAAGLTSSQVAREPVPPSR